VRSVTRGDWGSQRVDEALKRGPERPAWSAAALATSQRRALLAELPPARPFGMTGAPAAARRRHAAGAACSAIRQPGLGDRQGPPGNRPGARCAVGLSAAGPAGMSAAAALPADAARRAARRGA
jgi:hypothetical protein